MKVGKTIEPVIINGVEYASLRQAGLKNDISVSTLYTRKRNHWDDDDLLQPLSGDKSLKMSATINGETMSIWQLSQKTKIKYKSLRDRYVRGYRNEELLVAHDPRRLKLNINDQMYSMEDISKKYGISVSTLYSRFNRGKTGQDLIVPVGSGVTKLYVEYHNKKYSLRDIANEYDIKVQLVNYYYKKYQNDVDKMFHEIKLASSRAKKKRADKKDIMSDYEL